MASLRATHGSERIRSKLTKLIESNEFYEAHQLYRTLHFRYINCSRFTDLENLLYDGAILLLDRQQYNSGADLATLFIDTLTKDPNMKEAMKDELEGNQLAVRLGDLLSRIPAETPERMKFTAEALKLNPKVFPLQKIRRQFALILWKEGNYIDSRRHFLHCSYTCGEDCASMLIEYHTHLGYKSEADFFIAQFILQLLCIKSSNSANTEKIKSPLKSSSNSPMVASSSSSTSSSTIPSTPLSSSSDNNSLNLNDINPKSNQHAYANLTLQYYIAKHPQIMKTHPPFSSPLINYLWFLLIAIEHGEIAPYNVLLEKYVPVLVRDPSYRHYIRRIGELYFGLPPQPSNRGFGGFLGNLLQSFMEDNEEDSNEEDDPSSDGATDQQSTNRSTNSNNRPATQGSRQVPQANEELD